MLVTIKKSDQFIFSVEEVKKLPRMNWAVKKYSLEKITKQALKVIEMDTADVLKVEATLGRNQKVYNEYFSDSEYLDVWISIYAFDAADRKFVNMGFYLSDTWSLSFYNTEEFKNNMFIDVYSPEKYELQVPNTGAGNIIHCFNHKDKNTDGYVVEADKKRLKWFSFDTENNGGKQ